MIELFVERIRGSLQDPGSTEALSWDIMLQRKPHLLECEEGLQALRKHVELTRRVLDRNPNGISPDALKSPIRQRVIIEAAEFHLCSFGYRAVWATKSDWVVFNKEPLEPILHAHEIVVGELEMLATIGDPVAFQHRCDALTLAENSVMCVGAQVRNWVGEELNRVRETWLARLRS